MTVADWALYSDGRRQDGLDYDGAVAAARRGEGFVWIDLHQPDELRLSAVAKDFGLHPLAVEDAVEAHENPKVEHYEDAVFMVLKTVRYVPYEDVTVQNEVIETGELMVFAGSHFAITVSHGAPDEFDSVRERLEAEPKLLGHGPSAVLYAAADATVDRYLDVAERFETDMTEIEASVFADAHSNQAERIYRAKRELLKLRRAVVPLGQPMRMLSQFSLDLVPPKVQTYFRDVSDHLERVHGLLGGYDEIVNSMLQANLAQLTVSQNDDMRKITSWAAIIAVPTAIAGIYGMNFDHMPELRWSFGYPGVMVLMAAGCIALYLNFKRRGWL